MISSFFSKTKPINYLVLLIFLLIFYLLNYLITNIGFGNIVLVTLFFLSILLQVVGVQEIIRTRKITNPTSFAMLFFALLCMAVPQVTNYKEIVFGNFFLMLSLNRLLALKSLKQVKQKLFDATLWICVASVFDPLLILFLVVVFLAAHIYRTKEFKNWLVPFVAIMFFLLLISAFLIVTKNIVFLEEHYSVNISLKFLEEFGQNFHLAPFSFVVGVLILIAIVLIKQGYKGVGRVVHLRLLLVYFLISVIVFILKIGEANNYMSLFYSFFPAAIFATNFLEIIKRKRIRELVLALCVLFPFVLLILGFIK